MLVDLFLSNAAFAYKCKFLKSKLPPCLSKWHAKYITAKCTGKNNADWPVLTFSNC